MAARRDDHRFFVERVQFLKGSRRDRFGDEGGVEFTGEDRLGEGFRIADPQLQHNIGIKLVKPIERFGQPHRRGAFHRAKAKHAAWPGVMDRMAGLLGEGEQSVSVTEQHLPRGRQMQALAFAHEQRRAEIVLELAYPRRHIGLHAMQPFGGTRNAAFANHRAEDPELRQIHPSLQINVSQ